MKTKQITFSAFQTSCQSMMMTSRMKSVIILQRNFDKNTIRDKFATMKAKNKDIPHAQFLMQKTRFHNKYGIRYYILIICIIFYALLGGIIFHATEHNHETQYLKTNVKKLNALITDLTSRIFNVTNITLTQKKRNNVDELIKDFYQQMLEAEEKSKQSILYKYKQMKNGAFTWTFSSAIFYAITLFTTIGYGTIVCRTTTGKILTVMYSIIGIPLMLAVLQDIGNILLRYLTTAYNTYRRCFWKIRLRSYKISDSENNNDAEYKDVEFPLKLFIPITAIYLVICTVIVLIFNENRNRSSEMTFGDAFYFCFMTMATIGLGDVMPSNLEHNPMIALIFPFGLTLLSIINSNGYKKLEHCLISALINLELFFERLLRRPEGRMVFQWLAPNIELLTITLPIFGDNIIHDEIMQPTTDSYGSNNDRSTLEHEATLGIFSSASSNNNYKENMQLKYDMGILPKIDDIYEFNPTVQKKFIRRALTYSPRMQNVRLIRTMSAVYEMEK